MKLPSSVADVLPRSSYHNLLKEKRPLIVYLGIDPTTQRLHIGHGISINLLRKFHEAGHQCFLLLGDITAMIGDPTGRDKTREPLTYTETQVNAKKILTLIETYFGKIFHQYECNSAWLARMTVPEFLKFCGEFTVQQLEERDMFEKRREEGKGISVPEFLIPIMQGIDSVMLDVDIEIGGTDQLFNMLAGRKLQKEKEKVCITTKIINGTDGRKMSKTYDNCIWLDDSPEDKYGKTMSIPDSLVLEWAEALTDWPKGSIRELEKAEGSQFMQWKMSLAWELVRQYHSKEEAETQEKSFREKFKTKLLPMKI